MNARHREAAFEVDHRGAVADQRLDIGGAAHGSKLAVCDRHSLRPGLGFIDGVNLAVRINRVRHCGKRDPLGNTRGLVARASNHTSENRNR